MPEQSFAQSLQIAGSGFDTKLAGLMGIGQAIAQGQMMKTQMTQQLQQQKQLIDYRTDAQVRGQLEIEASQQPALEQQARRQSLVKANEELKELIDNNSEKYKDVITNGFGVARFFVGVNQGTGMYGVKIAMPNGDEEVEVDYQTYTQIMDSNVGMVNMYKDLQKGVQEGWFPKTSEIYDGQLKEDEQVQVTQEAAQETLSEIESTTDPRKKRAFLETFATGYKYPSKLGVGENQGRQTTDTTAGHAGNVINNMSEDGKVVIRHVPMEGGLWGIGQSPGKEKVRSIDVNRRNVAEIYTEVEELSEELYGINIKDIGSGGSDVMEAILSGNTKGLSGDYEDLAEKMEDLKEDDIAVENFRKLYDFYYGLQAVEDEWREKGLPNAGFGTTPRTDQLMFNPYSTNLTQRFIPMGDVTNRTFEIRAGLSQP